MATVANVEGIPAPPKSWAVQRLIIPIALVMAAVGTLLLVITFYSSRVMNADALQQQQALIDNSFTSRLTRGIGELRSVAWWDDAVTYTAAETFDQEWLDQELGSYMNESYKHDRIIVLDEKDRPVYAFGENTGLGTKQLATDLNATNAIIRQIRGGPDASPRVTTTAKDGGLYETGEFGNRKFSRGFGAIVSIDGKPALAMALLITPSFDTAKVSPVRRIVLSIIEINAKVLKEIGTDTMMPDLTFAKHGDERQGHFTLKTDTGATLNDLQWTPKRPGSEMLRRVLPWIGAALLTSILLLVLLMTRLLQSGTRLAQREHEAQHLANHDALTGLPNRRMLQSEVERIGEIARRNGELLTVASVDIDRFKDINDTLGHHAGDQLICGLARRLRQSVRGSDFVARLGGDEFAVLRRCDGQVEADDLQAVIRSCFDDPFAVNGHLVEANASTGITIAPPDRSFEELMREADIALYEAKARGRGCGIAFEPEMAQKIEKRRLLEVDLRKAIAQDELSVLYQPIVDAGTGRISSVEALARWTSARHGEVPPDVFIPIAEEAGLMAELGRLIIRRAVNDSLKWPHIGTAINISAAQLRTVSILRDLIEPTEAAGVPASRITIEITESVLMSNDGRTRRTLEVLKDHGFGLALDDFGTGYSSLAYIRDFPFDRLKIDRSFVHGLEDSAKALSIVEAIANFGRILGKEVVAEGIETEQEMQAMQAAGCTHLQGYLFARALPASRIEIMAAALARSDSEAVEKDVVAQRRISKRAARG
jgi:diguanylate cyclase (GGDEF)-like protein